MSGGEEWVQVEGSNDAEVSESILQSALALQYLTKQTYANKEHEETQLAVRGGWVCAWNKTGWLADSKKIKPTKAEWDNFVVKQVCLKCEKVQKTRPDRPFCLDCYRIIAQDKSEEVILSVGKERRRTLLNKYRWLDGVQQAQSTKASCVICNKKSFDSPQSNYVFWFGKRRICTVCLSTETEKRAYQPAQPIVYQKKGGDEPKKKKTYTPKTSVAKTTAAETSVSTPAKTSTEPPAKMYTIHHEPTYQMPTTVADPIADPPKRYISSNIGGVGSAGPTKNKTTGTKSFGKAIADAAVSALDTLFQVTPPQRNVHTNVHTNAHTYVHTSMHTNLQAGGPVIEYMVIPAPPSLHSVPSAPPPPSYMQDMSAKQPPPPPFFPSYYEPIVSAPPPPYNPYVTVAPMVAPMVAPKPVYHHKPKGSANKDDCTIC